MKNFVYLVLALISLNAFSVDENLGLGVIIGGPTGLSSNYKFSESRSLDAAVTYDFNDNSDFYLHSTYLFNHPKSIEIDKDLSLGWYAGIGGRMKSENDSNDNFRLGIRGSVGLNFELTHTPVDIFAELNSVMDFIEETDLIIGGAVGARYYF